MNKNKAILAGRYQYNPNDPIRQTRELQQYRVLDKALNNRSLIMHIIEKSDSFLEILRDFKHPFITAVLDVVPMDGTRHAIIIEPGHICSLEEVLSQVSNINEEDALVLFKFMVVAVLELHQKFVRVERLCCENFVFSNPGVVRIGYNIYSNDISMFYKSPESLNQQKQEFSSNVFTLGVILYRMIYGCFPFRADNEDILINEIKNKKYQRKETKSPMHIVVSKQIHYLLMSMLDYFPENRPTLQSILQSSYMRDIHVEPQQQKPQVKGKRKVTGGSIIPQSFYKKYLVIKQTKIMHSMCGYYNESAYMVVAVKQKTLMTLYCPQYKMYEVEPRKVESYYEKMKAIQDNYTLHGNEYICKLDGADRFRQEPVIVTQYCNQGNLYDYLQKRKVVQGWLNQEEVNIFMYILALALKQYREMGINSVHTLNYKTIMLSNANIKLREPGLLSVIVEQKLHSSDTIDFFAPQLKQKFEFVDLDKTDMWAFGVTYYYLLSGRLPQVNEENQIQLDSLKTHQKNRNLIGKCLHQTISNRIYLESVKIQNVNETILQYMLDEKQQEIENKERQQNQNREDSQQSEARQQKGDKKVVFKNRKRRIFKHYNKIIAQSSTSTCRVAFKAIISMIIIWVVFFGVFFVDGGVGLLKTNYYRPITFQVPSNFGTRLYNLTILTTDGKYIKQNYFSLYSHQQFINDLRCFENNYTNTNASYATVDSFVNGTQTVYCLFGFIYAIIFSVLWAIMEFKLDLPQILVKRNQDKSNKNLFHFIALFLIMPSLLFCFFYIWAFQYQIQMTPCLGLANLAYPKFTSIQSLLNGDMAIFFVNVFLTVILWSIAMFVFCFTSIFVKKINNYVFEWRVIVPVAVVMGVYILICRIGFGGPLPIEPTWSYKMNLDITTMHFGFFGFFPQLLILPIFLLGRLIDFIFWVFLKLGLQPAEEEDIKNVGFLRVKAEPTTDKQLKQAQIGMIQHKWGDLQFD